MRRYLVLDSSVVVGYFLPRATASKKAQERIACIVEAVRKRAVDDVVLYLPNVCIPEVFAAFAKYAYGRWNQEVKKPLHIRRYKSLRAALRSYLRHGAVFNQYEVNRYHVLATDLIAPVDHRFRIRRRRKQHPMRAADYLVVAIAMELSRVHTRERVTILTADQRMYDAVTRAINLNPNTARAMGLPTRAKEIGYEWGPEMYPRIVHLTHATKNQLVDVLGRWPLPTRAPRGTDPRAPGLRTEQ